MAKVAIKHNVSIMGKVLHNPYFACTEIMSECVVIIFVKLVCDEYNDAWSGKFDKIELIIEISMNLLAMK